MTKKSVEKSYKKCPFPQTECLTSPPNILNLQILSGQIVQPTNAVAVDDHDVESLLADDHSLLDFTGAFLHHIVGFILGDVWKSFSCHNRLAIGLLS